MFLDRPTETLAGNQLIYAEVSTRIYVTAHVGLRIQLINCSSYVRVNKANRIAFAKVAFYGPTEFSMKQCLQYYLMRRRANKLSVLCFSKTVA